MEGVNVQFGMWVILCSHTLLGSSSNNVLRLNYSGKSKIKIWVSILDRSTFLSPCLCWWCACQLWWKASMSSLECEWYYAAKLCQVLRLTRYHDKIIVGSHNSKCVCMFCSSVNFLPCLCLWCALSFIHGRKNEQYSAYDSCSQEHACHYITGSF